MFGIRMMGNVHTYAKQMGMETQWRQKQDSVDYTAKLDLTTGAAVEEEPQSVIGALTVYVPSEEEVERLRSTTLNKYMTRTKFIANNPNIEPEVKAIRIGAEKRKADDVDRNTKEFARKGEYAKLPTEAEVIEVMKAEAEERRAEMGLDPDGIPIEKKAEALKTPEAAEKTEQVEHGGKPEASEREKPEIDIETEAQRKVRRAKAKAAYACAQSDSRDDTGSGWSV